MGRVRYALGIDPGIDGTGLALVRHIDYTPGRAMPRTEVLSVETVRTKGTMPDPERLFHVALGVQAAVRRVRLLDETMELFVVLEVPNRVGQYGERAARGGANVNAAGMSKFWQALGVIRACLYPMACDGSVTLLERPPGRMKKEDRQKLFQQYTALGKNADERDAIVVACGYLSEKESVADVARRSARR